MDFSSAQIKAHSEEYADLMMSLTSGFKELSKETFKAQWQHYLQEANSVQVGCEIHFFRSGKRLMQNSALISHERKDKFMEMLYIMTAKSTTSEHFASTVNQIHEQFPRIHGWLEWWLRPAISSMIFPSKSSINPTLADKVPSTSNAIESQHFNLHSAMGKDHDALAGVHKLYIYVKQREQQYNALMGENLFLNYNSETNILHFIPSTLQMDILAHRSCARIRLQNTKFTGMKMMAVHQIPKML